MNCKYKLRCTMKDRYCKECKHNPKAELQDYFRDRGYVPVCRHGFDDCIHDPARRLYEYDEGDSWVREIYTREELIAQVENGCKYYDEEDCYDDEDK